MTVTSLNDITIICFPFSGRKNLAHVQQGYANLPVYLLASLPSLLTTVSAMYELSHQFCIPTSEPVTLSPGYFGEPSYWRQKQYKTMYNNMARIMTDDMAW